MPKCDECGKDFKNDLALKIHVGRQHKKGGKTARKAAAAAPAQAGGITCRICGRAFNLPAHLARHLSAAHAKKKKAGRPGRRPARKATGRTVRASSAEAAIAPSVRALTVDQLLILKRQVDARLADIARQMRAAKVSL